MSDVMTITETGLKFDEEHPAVEALKNEIESYKAAYDQLAGELDDAEREETQAEAVLDEAISRVKAVHEAITYNDRQQAALRDAIEYLTGKRP